MRKPVKRMLEAIAGVQKINFEIEKESYVLLYNESNFGEGEALRCIKEQDYDNSKVAVMRKEQYENVFMISENRT